MGEKEWKGSLKMLTGQPVLIVIFRGVNCAVRIQDVVSEKVLKGREVSFAWKHFCVFMLGFRTGDACVGTSHDWTKEMFS